MPKPIPFVGSPGQRGTGTTDQRFVNVLFEVEKNPSPTSYPVACIKRPGLSTSTRPTGASTEGRGIYSWGATASLYSFFGGDIYVNGTKMTSTASLSTSTVSGRVWFAETHEDTGNRQLVICDGLDNYIITSTNIITQIDQVDDAQYPVSSCGPVVMLDGFMFMAKPNGQIWNTDVNTVSSWTATAYLTADTFGSELEAIHKQKDQIIAFTKNRIEFYFNNGNPTGSPLLRIDQNTLGFGIASKNSLAWSGETVIFVSENSADGDGSRSIYMITSLGKVTEISNPSLNRLLAVEGASISACSAWMERVAGQLIYCLNLSVANRSFIYSVDTGLWCEWASASGAKFNCVSATSRNGVVYLQDGTNGWIYTLSPTVYTDGGTVFTLIIQTPRSAFGTEKPKIETTLTVFGDNTAGNLWVSTSDDDYGTFTSTRGIDMSLPLKQVTRLGSFQSRAHKFSYNTESSFRVQAWLPEIKEGK